MYVGEVLERYTCRDRDVDIEREGLACTLIKIDRLPEDFEEMQILPKTAKEIKTVDDIIRFVKDGGKK